MQAIQIQSFGGPEQLHLTNIARPAISAGQILVKVAAAGVNPVDNMISSGSMPFLGIKPPVTLGCELAGVVAETASSLFQNGDEVYAYVALNRNGAFAEYAIVFENEAAPKPARLSFAESASVPVGALTAWEGIFDNGHLESGQKILIHGAAGAVGSMAVQLAKWKGAHVIGTATGENIEYLRQVGADEVIDYKSKRFEENLSNLDLVFDCVGGDTQERSLAVLRKGGILVSTVAPPSKEKVARAGVTAAMVAVQPSRENLIRLNQLIESGKLKTRVDRVLPVVQGIQALEIVRSGQNKGKIVIAME